MLVLARDGVGREDECGTQPRLQRADGLRVDAKPDIGGDAVGAIHVRFFFAREFSHGDKLHHARNGQHGMVDGVAGNETVFKRLATAAIALRPDKGRVTNDRLQREVAKPRVVEDLRHTLGVLRDD